VSEDATSLVDDVSGRGVLVLTKTGIRLSWELEIMLARQYLIERLTLADWPKMMPRSMLMHPRERRKKAATRVKSSTK